MLARLHGQVCAARRISRPPGVVRLREAELCCYVGFEQIPQCGEISRGHLFRSVLGIHRKTSDTPGQAVPLSRSIYSAMRVRTFVYAKGRRD